MIYSQAERRMIITGPITSITMLIVVRVLSEKMIMAAPKTEKTMRGLTVKSFMITHDQSKRVSLSPGCAFCGR